MHLLQMMLCLIAAVVVMALATEIVQVDAHIAAQALAMTPIPVVPKMKGCCGNIRRLLCLFYQMNLLILYVAFKITV